MIEPPHRVLVAGPTGTGPAHRAVALRPLATGEILDGAFRLVRTHPRVLLGLGAAVGTVQAVLLALVDAWLYHRLDTSTLSGDAYSVAGSYTSLAASLLIGGVLAAASTAAVAVVLAEDVRGARPSAGLVWRRLRPRLAAITALAVILGVVPVLGLALLTVPGVWLWGVWTVAMPALALERVPIRAALPRSMALVRGSFWRTWGIRALSVLVTSVVGSLVSVPFAVLAGLAGGQGANPFDTGAVGLPLVSLAITSVGAIVSGTLTLPVRCGVDCLLYLDLRMRREGLDLLLRHDAALGRDGAR